MDFAHGALLPPYVQNIQFRRGEDGSFERLRNIEIVNLAFRRKPPAPTGGPNGVLLNLQRLLGEDYRGVALRYVWQPKGYVLPERWKLWAQANQLSTMAKNLLEAHSFVVSHLGNTGARTPFFTGRTGLVFVCHDIGSAAAAAMGDVPFVLVSHMQGSFRFERESFGESLNDVERELFDRFERLAFTQALRVYFPSRGAKEVFLRSTEAVKEHEVRFADVPLYNAVDLDGESIESPDQYLHDVGRPDLADATARAKYRIVVSVGDYSWNKGLDLCPPILARLAERSDKPILWFALGAPHKTGIYERMSEDQHSWPFDAVLSPHRIPHPQLLGLVREADLFLMQHRNAIFDFGVLEALALGTPVALSPVDGNLEMNVDGNVTFVDSPRLTDEDVAGLLRAMERPRVRASVDEGPSDFSPAAFAKRYMGVYDGLIEDFLGDSIRSAQAKPSFWSAQGDACAALRELFEGKDVVLVGSGSSATDIGEADLAGKTLVALNAAVKLPLAFHVHVRQDSPPDKSEFASLGDQVVRVYGEISRTATEHLRLTDDDLDQSRAPLIRYLLSPVAHDVRHDAVRWDRENCWVPDLYGVLFSAMYIASLFGARSVALAGVDYSPTNFDGPNPNRYNTRTYASLLAMRNALVDHGTDVGVVATTSAIVRHIVEEGAMPPPHLLDGTQMAGARPSKASPHPIRRGFAVKPLLREATPPFAWRLAQAAKRRARRWSRRRSASA